MQRSVVYLIFLMDRVHVVVQCFELLQGSALYNNVLLLLLLIAPDVPPRQ